MALSGQRGAGDAVNQTRPFLAIKTVMAFDEDVNVLMTARRYRVQPRWISRVCSQGEARPHAKIATATPIRRRVSAILRLCDGHAVTLLETEGVHADGAHAGTFDLQMI